MLEDLQPARMELVDMKQDFKVFILLQWQLEARWVKSQYLKRQKTPTLTQLSPIPAV